MLPPASALRMMAARLSDETLCKELGKYGEKVKLPLNDSKRSILQKKLNHLQAKNKRKSAPMRHKSYDNDVSGFSSDNDDSALVKNSTTKTLPKSASASSRTTRAAAAAAAAAAASNASPTPSRSSIPKRKSTSNLNNDDHLSDNTHNNSKYGLYSQTSGSNQTSRKSPGVISYHSSLGSTNTDIDSQSGNSIYANHQVHHRRSANLKPPLTTSSRTGIYFDSTDSDIDEDENFIASKSSTFSNSFAAKGSPIYSSHYSSVPRTGNVSSPTLPATSTPQKKTTQILKEFRQNYSKVSRNPFKSNFWEYYIPYDFRHVGEKNSHCISRILPIAMVLFFTFLGIMYIRNWSESSLSPQNNEASKLVSGVCTKYLSSSHECSKVDINGVLKLLKMFHDNLSVRYGNILCGQNLNGNSKNMSKEVVGQFIAAEVSTELILTEKLIMWLIISNEDWGIRPLTVDGTIPEKMEELAYVESYTPYMSFTCRLRRAIFDTMYQLLFGCLGFILLVLLLRFCLVQYQKKEEEQHQIYEMVEKIIDTLKSECEAMSRHDEEPYLAVQHVRDKLLPPPKRKQLLPIWNKAAKFIEENESRIRHETRIIEGEEFDVWRWLPVCSTGSPHMNQSLSLNNGGKIWQGQAFGEHDDLSNNTPPYSPTPCLKVRNMFKADVEEGDDWDVHIEDAILEKCKNINGILHIHVDKTSKEGCVYIKCDNCETAGNVYRSLHGWWFDRRLVTVKYLRLDMYHERFPSSRVAVKAMKPSSHSRTHSMCQQPLQRYSLQMT